MANEKTLFPTIRNGKITTLSLKSVSSIVPEKTFLQYCQPQTLIDICRLRNLSKHPISARGDKSREVLLQYDSASEFKTGQSIKNDQIEEPVEERDIPKKTEFSNLKIDKINKKQEVDSFTNTNENGKKPESTMLGLFFGFQMSEVSSLLLMTLLSVLLLTASAKYLEKPVTKWLLSSKTCSLRNFYSLKSKCHRDEKLYNWTVDHCQFLELCETDEVPVCLDAEKLGVYVCLKRSLSCPRGRMIIARQDDKLQDVVHVQEVDCPNGTYQSTESDCIHACSYQHRDVTDMDGRYLLSSIGDNKSPTYAYCNFKIGYYNPDGKLTFNYDEDPFMDPYLCIDDDKCGNRQHPLPDGLCVNKCDDSFERNPPDFHCRKMNTAEDISTITTRSKIAQETSQMSSTKSYTEGIYSSVLTETSGTSVETNDVNDENDDKSSTAEDDPWWPYILYGLLGLAISIGIIACIYRRKKSVMEWLKKRPFNCERHRYVENKHGNLTYRIKGTTVNFSHYGNKPGPADSLIGEETIV